MCLGIPGEVLAVEHREGVLFAQVCFGPVCREVCLAYQPQVQVGNFVLVHVGFAIATINKEAAEQTWLALRELGRAGDGEL